MLETVSRASRSGRRRTPRLLRVAVSASVVVALITASLSLLLGQSPDIRLAPVHAGISNTSHGTISINGNSQFTNASGVVWGSGIVSDPYIIADWDINASTATGILVWNTDAHFMILNCYIYDGGLIYPGIYLLDCTNGTLINNTCSNNYWGIDLHSSSNSTISSNNCSNSRWGIYLHSSSNNNTLSNNTCSNNGWGIYLSSSSNSNTISNNTCSNNGDGIGIFLSSMNNTLANNNCSSNTWYGIYLSSSSNNNTLSNNTCSNNGWGIYLSSSSNSNTISNNTCSNNGDGIGIFLSSINNTLSNNTCSSNNQYGIYLYTSSNNTLNNNNCSNNDNDIYLFFSSNNTLSNNTCSDNGWGTHSGITLDWSSNNNTLIRNRLCDNLYYGVNINGGSFNLIWNNTLIGNNGASSTYNPTHIQAYDLGTDNRWNSSSGYGNYWSDWTSPDIVAPWWIVDYPYSIAGGTGAKDYYPLSFAPENIAPITTASSTGTMGTNGWFKSNVSVSLSATDAGSGVNATFYRIGTSGSWLNYSTSFLLSSDGDSTARFYSMDNAGNTESVKSITVKIDKTSPTLTVNRTSGFTSTVDYVIISWISSDATSGIERFEVSIDGGAFASVGMAMSHNFSGLIDGTHNVTVKAVDAAGNAVNKTIQFTVDTSVPSGGGTSGDLTIYIVIIVIIILAIIAAIVITMRKKKSPPMRLDEMKAEPPAPPAN